MIWIACASSWLATSAAVIYAISATGRISPLWALLIPACVSYSTKWNRRAQPANDPLTLEQLREMDGEPVYIKYHTCGRWEIYQGFMHDHGLYGKTWLAYRRPPERSENDA